MVSYSLDHKTAYTWLVQNFSTLNSLQERTFYWNGYSFHVDLHPKGYETQANNQSVRSQYTIVSIYQSNVKNSKHGCKITILDRHCKEWMTAVGQIITKQYTSSGYVNYSGLEMRIYSRNIHADRSEVVPDDKLTIMFQVFNLTNCDCPLVTSTKETKERIQTNTSNKLNLKCLTCTSREEPLYDLKPVQENLSSLLAAATLSDVICEVDSGKEFKLHKNILAARSPVFKAMFTKDMQESRLNRFKVPDISVESFEEALGYLYSGRIPQMEQCALELFEFSDKYDIKSLKILCEEWLSGNLALDSVIATLILADMHSASLLKSKCMDYISANFKQVSKNKSFEQLESRSKLLMEVVKHLHN